MAHQSELEKLKRRYEEKPSQWFAALAEEHRRAGDVELALQIVREGLENRSNYVSGHIVLARCLLDRGEDAGAQQELERVLELDGENVIALKVLSEIAERLGDPIGARGWVDRLLEVDPMNEEAQLMVGRLGDVGAATSKPSFERPSWADLAELKVPEAEPEAPPPEPEAPAAAEEESPPSPQEPEAPQEESPPSSLGPPPSPAEPAAPQEESPPPPAEPAEASAEIAGADVEHDTPLELSPEAGEGPPPDDIIGVQVERPEPIELVGGPGMVVGKDQSGELVGRPEDVVAPSTEEPEPVVTQTMAEVYVKQGLLDSALKVYRELLAQRPEDPELLSRIAELESGAPAPGDAPVDSEKPPYLASETGGMSARAFLAAVIAAGESGDTPSPGPLPEESTPLKSAFDTSDGSEISGAPTTHPAPDGASLSSVFGEEGEVSFDEFFGGTAPKQETTEGSEPSGGGGGEATEAERDDADFKDWLKGLKS